MNKELQEGRENDKILGDFLAENIRTALSDKYPTAEEIVEELKNGK